MEKPRPDDRTARAEAGPWLVVIDHREARIYRSAQPGAVPQQIRSPAPASLFRPSPQAQDGLPGWEKSDPGRFFEPVAGVLNGAGKILIFGGDPGLGSEMHRFIAWLKHHRPELAGRIVGSLTMDDRELSEGELLTKARKYLPAAGPEPIAAKVKAAFPESRQGRSLPHKHSLVRNPGTH